MNIDDDAFDTIVSGSAIIDFYADWCGPCKMVGKAIRELNTKKVKIYTYDVDKYSVNVSTLGVRSIPTLSFFKNGKEVHRHTGMITRNELEALIDKHY